MQERSFSEVVIISILILISFSSVAQTQSFQESINTTFQHLELIPGMQRPSQIREKTGKLEQIGLMKNGFGWTRNRSILWRTKDKGNSWQEITPPKASEQRLSGASFIGENGIVVLANLKTDSFELVKTNNGDDSWTKLNIELPAAILEERNLELQPTSPRRL
jgi:hypothetical protein